MNGYNQNLHSELFITYFMIRKLVNVIKIILKVNYFLYVLWCVSNEMQKLQFAFWFLSIESSCLPYPLTMRPLFNILWCWSLPLVQRSHTIESSSGYTGQLIIFLLMRKNQFQTENTSKIEDKRQGRQLKVSEVVYVASADFQIPPKHQENINSRK